MDGLAPKNRTTTSSTRLALLATLSNLHVEPVSYDLASLQTIITKLDPDLLCADITRPMCEGGDLSQAAIEVREALAPVVAATDVVLIPIAPDGSRFADFAPEKGWRRSLVRSFDRMLQWGQRQADTPEAVNGPFFELFCHPLCLMTEWSWTAGQRRAWQAQNKIIADNILQAVRQDSGRRVLVAVQCQRIHQLEPLLKQYANELDIVDYWEL
jgi:hypothetical protein